MEKGKEKRGHFQADKDTDKAAREASAAFFRPRPSPPTAAHRPSPTRQHTLLLYFFLFIFQLISPYYPIRNIYKIAKKGK